VTTSTPGQRVVLATNNVKKLAELRRIVSAAAPTVEVLGLADVASYPEPEETELTFEGNALLKARACVAATGLPSLADDSGLCVDVLNQMPGVRSARWSGPGASDAANNELLLRQLEDVPDGRRGATFVSAMALVLPNGVERVRRGEMPGRLIRELRGHNGFGYDAMFVPDGGSLTTAELSAADKDAISHRGKAVRAIVSVLIEELQVLADHGLEDHVITDTGLDRR
jgi:XTP/dITP diphosphohydrolase